MWKFQENKYTPVIYLFGHILAEKVPIMIPTMRVSVTHFHFYAKRGGKPIILWCHVDTNKILDSVRTNQTNKCHFRGEQKLLSK